MPLPSTAGLPWRCSFVKVLAVVDAEEKARLAREEASKAARETQAPAPARPRQMWAGVSRFLGADVGGVSPVPAQTSSG